MQPKRFTTPEGRSLAYHLTPGKGPTIVFLGGLRSDMAGTKALALEEWAQANGRAFLRFDYSGHGESSGSFEEGCIGDWHQDTCAALSLIDGPLVLVGSSMGGWQALLAARSQPERIAGLVTIAAAPDFTDDLLARWSNEQKAELEAKGHVAEPSDYGDPMIFTRRLVEDSANHRILTQPLHLPCPTRFLQGTADVDVPEAKAHAILAHATGPDLRLTLVKDADHRFSDPACLSLIISAVQEVSQ